MTMHPCKFLDYTEGAYAHCSLATAAPHYPDVRYWIRGPAWTDNGTSTPNPSRVQFCLLKGRINGIFPCYTGELPCYEKGHGWPTADA